MSFFDILFDSNARQRANIDQLKEQSRRINKARRRQVVDLESRTTELEHEVGVLALLCRSLIELLHKKNIWNAAEFREICRRIDLEDGKEDGQARLQS